MDFDRIYHRRNTDSIKWNTFPEDVLPMWIADMDFRSPEPVIKALHERVDHGIFGYGCPPQGLKEAIANHLAKRQNWQVEHEEISFISGVVTGFSHAVYSFTEPGDRIMFQTPAYPPFLSLPESTGREALFNELVQGEDGKYYIDFDDFAKKAASGVKLFILCNPQNPSGRVFSREELMRMAEICLDNDVIICSDEIHADLVYSESQHIPIASLSPEISDQTVTYFAPSKTFNIAGLSTSVYVATNPEIRERLAKSMCMLLGHPNILGLQAALAAYHEGGEWLDEVLGYLQNNRDYLADFVASELDGIQMWKPEGTYLGWLDCRDLDLDESPYQFFLDKAKVGLNDGLRFGEPGRDFVRMNFGCPRPVLEQALNQMRSALLNRN
jgi:cystathionine beta-lyase